LFTWAGVRERVLNDGHVLAAKKCINVCGCIHGLIIIQIQSFCGILVVLSKRSAVLRSAVLKAEGNFGKVTKKKI